jgi:hypothetical protein
MAVGDHRQNHRYLNSTICVRSFICTSDFPISNTATSRGRKGKHKRRKEGGESTSGGRKEGEHKRREQEEHKRRTEGENNEHDAGIGVAMCLFVGIINEGHGEWSAKSGMYLVSKMVVHTEKKGDKAKD